MKKTNIIYWILTALFAGGMLFSAIPDIIVRPEAVAFFKGINMPAYLLPFLGIAKALGVAAILVPGFPRLKEWAYAGLIFDLAGAVFCNASSGFGINAWWPILIFMAVGFASYAYYHKRKRALAQSHHAASVNTAFIQPA